jgi:hypothetical protein
MCSVIKPQRRWVGRKLHWSKQSIRENEKSKKGRREGIVLYCIVLGESIVFVTYIDLYVL